jgi:hypothetical protein
MKNIINNTLMMILADLDNPKSFRDIWRERKNCMQAVVVKIKG